jgi:hypothetical protein
MLFRAIGQSLGTDERVKESCWEIPKGYERASRKF